MPLSQGQVLNNRYRIVKLLGQGGFGAVYRAWDTSLNAPCALKENYDSSPDAARQFAKEASLLANLRHSNLTKVTDHFSLPGQGQYLVMEYIDGQDLQEILDDAGGPLPEAQVLEWIGQVCDALIYLHSRTQPIIHRDLKPANIRITPEGQAVLVDFGIAKVYDPVKRTSTAARAVTPGYAPFEQYGQKPTDARTDIYALGATVYHLLTGQKPPDSIDRMGGTQMPPLRQLNPAVSAHVDTVVMKALEVQPGDRWQSAVEFKSALRSTTFSSLKTTTNVGKTAANIFPPPATSPPISSKSANPFSGRSKWLGGGIGVGAAIVLISLILIFGTGIKRKILTDMQTATQRAIISQTEIAFATNNVTLTPLPLSATPTPTETARHTETATLTPTPSGPFIYEIQEGDNLWDISVRFNVDYLVLITVNDLDPNNPSIQVGQKLTIPGSNFQLPTATPLPDNLPRGTRISYQVQMGDSLLAIALRFNSTIEDIKKVNNIENEIDINVGQILVIRVNLVTPVPTSTPTPTTAPGG